MNPERTNRQIHFSEANTFEEFKALASRTDLSNIEKIGFPDDYRVGFEELIFNDISEKLALKSKLTQHVLDIGSGCSGLPLLFHGLAKEYEHNLFFLDSFEMLSNIPPQVLSDTHQIFARFPDCSEFLTQYSGKFDSISCYSVIQYAFHESSLFSFLDALLRLLKPGGRGLIGDIPNISMKKRFLVSESGIQFHENNFQNKEKPNVEWNTIEEGHIDDSVVISIILRARAQGFHAYLVPQNSSLPLSNRREDILIVKP